MSTAINSFERRAGEPITIRPARHDDGGELARLAELDSTIPPQGPALIAERDGVAIAALPLASGPAVADPFTPTAEAVAMLELRRTQLENAAGRSTTRVRPRPLARLIGIG